MDTVYRSDLGAILALAGMNSTRPHCAVRSSRSSTARTRHPVRRRRVGDRVGVHRLIVATPSQRTIGRIGGVFLIVIGILEVTGAWHSFVLWLQDNFPSGRAINVAIVAS